MCESVWSACVADVQARLSTPASRAWFEETEPLALTDDAITLRAPNSFAKEWLEHRYANLLADALRRACGRDLRVEILTGAGGGAGPIPIPIPSAPSSNRLSEDEPSAALNPRYNFDTFVIGASNRFAHAAAMAVAEAPASAYNPLFIYGEAGLGQDPPAPRDRQALGRALSAPAREVRQLRDVHERLHQRDQGRPVGSLPAPLPRSDVLLVDDIQFLENKERTQEEFFHTFNALHNANRQIIISSDRPPKKIATLEDRLRSRFEWGLITDIQPPDLETRIAILRKKAEMDHLTVAEDVMSFIASRVESNIRELEGALIRVIAYASLNQTTATLDLAEEVLVASVPDLRGRTGAYGVDHRRRRPPTSVSSSTICARRTGRGRSSRHGRSRCTSCAT